MVVFSRLFCVATFCLCLTACETINVRRSVPIVGKNATSVFIDAKQRAVTYAPSATITTAQNGTSTTVTPLRICAEASPDALTAIATSARANASVNDQVNAAVGIERAETAASIGLRTQSIQLMRDVLYRLCEDYQSGALTPAGVETLQRRYQSSMVAILAIEQLTGVVRAPPVLLGSQAASGGADSVAKIYDAKAKATSAKKVADDKVAQTETANTAASKALSDFLADGGETDVTKMDDARKAKYKPLKEAADKAQTDLDTAQASATDAASALKDASTAMSALGAGDGNASGTAAIETGSDPRLQPGDAATIAGAVQNIVGNTLNLGFLREACATMIVATIEGRYAGTHANAGATPNSDDFASVCQAYSQATVKSVTAENDRSSAISDLIRRTDPTTDNLKLLAQIVAQSGGAPVSAAQPAILTSNHIVPFSGHLDDPVWLRDLNRSLVPQPQATRRNRSRHK